MRPYPSFLRNPTPTRYERSFSAFFFLVRFLTLDRTDSLTRSRTMRHVRLSLILGLLALIALPSVAHAHRASMSRWIPAPALSSHASPLTCLSAALYREARGESDRGMAAVGYVILNRARAHGYPPDICGVVTQSVRVGKHRYCQFSWACTKLRHTKVRMDQYQRAQLIAILVMHHAIPNPVGDAIYFHEASRHRRPSRHAIRVARIQHHVFYADARVKIPPLMAPDTEVADAGADALAANLF